MTNLIQIVKNVSHDDPRPYRLVETYVTSEGMRSRICSGAYATLGEADFQRETLEKIVKGGRVWTLEAALKGEQHNV